MPDTPEGLTVADSGMSDVQKNFINENFRAAMSEEHGAHASMADFTDVDGLGKSLINAQKMVGADKLPMPNKKWGKQDWTDFNQKIGMPADAKDYELTAHEGSTDEDIEWFSKIAHEDLQLSKMQAQKMWDGLNSRNGTALESLRDKQKTKLDEANQALREEWGVNYDNMVSATNKGLERLDEGGRFRNWMKQTGLNQQPEMLRFANKVAELFKEDSGPGTTQNPHPISKEQAAGQYKKMYSEAMKNGVPDLSHALFNKKDPGHEDAVKKASKLAVLAGGEM